MHVGRLTLQAKVASERRRRERVVATNIVYVLTRQRLAVHITVDVLYVAPIVVAVLC